MDGINQPKRLFTLCWWGFGVECGRELVGVSPPSFLLTLIYMFNNYSGVLCVYVWECG